MNMNKLLDRFVYLLGVRKIIALTLTGTFVCLSVNGLITKDEFLPIFSLVIGYYFGKSTALEKPHEQHEHEEEKNQGG